MQLPKFTRLSPRTKIIALLAGILGLFLCAHFRTPAPEPPSPRNLGLLDPQLREYILRNLIWIRAAPRHADRHATLGIIYAVNGLWLEARAAFRNAALLAPYEPLSRMYEGVTALEIGNLAEAVTIFRDVTVHFPNFAPGFYRLGYASLRAGNPDEAESAFKRLTTLAPDEWRGYAGIGEVMMRRERYALAVPFLEKAVQLDRTAKTAHHLLGQAYQKLGRRDDADWELQLGRNAVDSPMLDAWAKTAQDHIKTLQGETELAAELSESGRPDKAAEILANAYTYHPDNVGLMNQFAIALDRCGRPDKAIEALTRALAIDDHYVPALITLSLCQQKLDKNEAALASAERAISLAPNVAQGYVAQANAFLGLEKDDDALKALERAVKLDPQNPELPTQMGDIMWRNLNRPVEAYERYEIARKLDPVFAPVYLRLTDLHLKLGEIDQARSCISKLQKLSPNIPGLIELEERLEKQEKPSL